MPKMKSHSASKKRFKKVSDGSVIKRSNAYRRHLLTKKTSKRKRHLRENVYICSADEARIKILIPY